MTRIKILAVTTMIVCLFCGPLLVNCAANAANEKVYITGVKPVPAITVDWLVPYEEVVTRLPSTAIITLSNGSEVPVTLNWIAITDPKYPEFVYSPYSSGVYKATATFELPENVHQPDPPIPLIVTTNVTQMTPLLPGLYTLAKPLSHPDYKHLFSQPGTYASASITIGGIGRTYHYYIPTSYDGTKPVPLVISLHGYTSCGLANLLGVDDCAEKYGFIALCPDGYPPRYLGWAWDRTRDVPFISALIDKMIDNYNIDTSRIYVVGISMGGWMATNLAYDLYDRIAAIGIISGSRGLAAIADAGIPLPRPMTFILTAGTDEWVFGSPFYEHLNARKSTSYLVQQLHCDPHPEVTFWPPTAQDRTNITRYVYSGGIYGTQVIYFEIGLGGHGWPGGIQYAIPSGIGWITQHIEAWENCLWPYLSKHSIPQEVIIDIRPRSFPNTINLQSQGIIPVAIITTDNFDVTKVDPETVRFGREGWEAKPAHYAFEDIDGDNDIDMILHFPIQETGIQLGDTEAKLTGRSFYGTDTIKTIVPKQQKTLVFAI
ncbi:MAG: PHB depolymerase family esterase [Candidatus Bathyarchaeia archaeon]